MQMPPPLFDRRALLRNRARASDGFLHEIACSELLDRLQMVNREFTNPLIINAPTLDLPGAGAEPSLHIADDDTLGLSPASHDLAIHVMGLHWANDPLGQVIQCSRALRPDGLFLAACLGGTTLHELRTCLTQAESEITGGLTPRIAPMAEIRDLGALLQRAGLALPVADSTRIRVSYDSVYDLMRDLRRFGEGNALQDRQKHPTRRAIFERCAALYAERFSEDGRLIASFDFLYLAGWAPDASQPRPLAPGSARHSLAEALNPSSSPKDTEQD